MTRKKSERMVKLASLTGIIVAVVGLGLVANPSDFTRWMNGLAANQIAWVGLGLIVLGIYIFKKSG
jgi:Na+/pantothenate symporter